MKTLFLLYVICVIYYGLKPKEFLFFRACLNIAWSIVYFFYTIPMSLGCGDY